MSTDRHWRAIVAFTDTDDVSDDWSWFYSELRDACADTGVAVVHAELEDAEVVVGPGARVSLGPFRAQHRSGYVFAEEGREPSFAPYDQPGPVLRAASAYFGLDLTPSR